MADTAVLSSATSNAGGTVTYEVFNNNTCASAGLVSTLGPVTVTGAVVPTSPSWTATVAGTFYFVAVYSGDANNTGATSGCGAQPVTVTPPVIVGNLTINNGPSPDKPGRPEAGDTIVVTFTTPVDLYPFCSSWSSTNYPTPTGPNIAVLARETKTTGLIASVSDSSDCLNGFVSGAIDMGQTGYFSSWATFSGGSISWNATNTFAITRGTSNRGQPTQKNHSSAVCTPDPKLGYTGTIASPIGVNF